MSVAIEIKKKNKNSEWGVGWMTLKNVWFDPPHETVRFASEVVNINHA